jgi:hypothetical protein
MQLDWDPPRPTLSKGQFEWAVDYAADVHEGRERRDGSDMPARPFAMAAVDESDPEELFRHLFIENNLDFDAAFIAFLDWYNEAFEFYIEDDRWEWDRTTLRRNGQVVTSPRDAVDTGNLLRSQSLTIT